MLLRVDTLQVTLDPRRRYGWKYPFVPVNGREGMEQEAGFTPIIQAVQCVVALAEQERGSCLGKPYRVVLAEDQGIVRDGVRALCSVEPDLEVVGEISDGAEAIRLAAETRPDVVILDLTMPRISVLEALPEIKKVSPETRVVVLTVTTPKSSCVQPSGRAPTAMP